MQWIADFRHAWRALLRTPGFLVTSVTTLALAIGAVVGMFSVVKVRDDQPRGSYKDPGWYRHPAGSVAREFTGELHQPTRAVPAKADTKADRKTLTVRRPSAHGSH